VAKCAEGDIVSRISTMHDHAKELERQISALQSRLINSKVTELIAGAVELGNDAKLVVTLWDAQDLKEMELLCDRVRAHAKNLIVVAAATIDGRAHIMVAISPDLIKREKQYSAGALVQKLSALVDGKGGGKPDFARGGGPSVEKLASALQKVHEIVLSDGF